MAKSVQHSRASYFPNILFGQGFYFSHWTTWICPLNCRVKASSFLHKYFFTLLVIIHHPATWAGSRARSPASESLVLAPIQFPPSTYTVYMLDCWVMAYSLNVAGSWRVATSSYTAGSWRQLFFCRVMASTLLLSGHGVNSSTVGSWLRLIFPPFVGFDPCESVVGSRWRVHNHTSQTSDHVTTGIFHS